MGVILESPRPLILMKPKAHTIIHMVEGKRIRVAEPFSPVEALMNQAQPFRVTRITDHGATKDATVRAGAILYLERA